MSEESPPRIRFDDIIRIAEVVYKRVMTELGPLLPAGIVSQEAHSNLERAWMERNEECNRLLREKENLQAQVDELRKMLDTRNHLLEKLDQEYQAIRFRLDPLLHRIQVARDALDPGMEVPR